MSSTFFDINNNRLAKTLRDLISREANLSPSSLAEKLGMPRNKVTRILNGEVNDPKASTLTPIAQYFGISIDELLGVKGLDSEILKNSESIAIVERPYIEQANIVKWLNENYSPKQYFKIATKEDESLTDCFISKIDSDALVPIITSSMFLIIKKNYEVKSGDYIVASNMTDIILRKLNKEGSDIYLSSINPIYKTIKIEGDWFIIGKIIDARLFLI